MGVQISQLANEFAQPTIPVGSFVAIDVLGDDNVYRTFKIKGDKLQTLLQPYRLELAKLNKSVSLTARPAMDIGVQLGDLLFIGHDDDTDTNNVVTDFGVASSGTKRTLFFDGGITLTQNPLKIQLPTGADYVTQSGDIGVFRSNGAAWFVESFIRADGTCIRPVFRVDQSFSEISTNDAAKTAARLHLGLVIGSDVVEGDVMPWTATLAQLIAADSTDELLAILGLTVDEDVLVFFPQVTTAERRAAKLTDRRTFSPRDVARLSARTSYTGLPGFYSTRWLLNVGNFSLSNRDVAGGSQYCALSLDGAAGEETLSIGPTSAAPDDFDQNAFARRWQAVSNRVDDYGNFQLYNPGQAKFQTVRVKGLVGAETLDILAADAENDGRLGLMLVEVPASYRFLQNGEFQLWNEDQQAFHSIQIHGAVGEETYTIGPADVTYLN